VPSRARLLLAVLVGCGGVGDELPVDHIGQSSAQAAQGFQRGLAFGELAAAVGAAGGVVADLADRGDVEDVVKPPVAGAGEPVPDLGPEEASRGAVPVQEANRLRSANRATSPTSARIRAAPAGPMP
jgi:hypothetical protein